MIKKYRRKRQRS